MAEEKGPGTIIRPREEDGGADSRPPAIVAKSEMAAWTEAHRRARANFPKCHENAMEFEAAVRGSKSVDECVALIVQLFDALGWWLERAPADGVMVLWGNAMVAMCDGFAAAEKEIRKNPRPDLEPIMSQIREALQAPQAHGTTVEHKLS